MLGNKLYRKAALEKLSSPERLDEMMRVTSPVGWLALVAIGIVLVGVCVWGFVGKITDRVSGQGILLRGGAVLDVTASYQGRLTEILVGEYDFVEQGEVIARLINDDLRNQIGLKKSRLQQMRDGGGRDDRNIAVFIEAARATIRSAQGAISDLNRQLANQQELLDQDLITPARVRATRDQIRAEEAKISGANREIADLNRQRDTGSDSIEELQAEIGTMEDRLEREEKIVSQYSGRVLELTTDPGALVSPGARILTLEEVDGTVEAFVYVEAGDGKKVQPGMRVRVSPSTVKREEFGFMVGEVKTVSEFPVSPEGLRRTLRNDRLVSQLAGDAAPIEVVVTLMQNADTPSGYEWSSSQGPPNRIFTGTICNGEVEVDFKRPVEYVLPIMKKTLGVASVGAQ